MSNEVPHRISTATLVLGVSGAGKTSLAETLAEYLWDTSKQVLCLYSWDGGAIPTGVQKRMHQGLIRFWRARTRSTAGLALETLTLATKGYWPQRIDPRTGETEPSVKLIPPVTQKFTLICDKGHTIKAVPFASLIVPNQCPTCKLMIPVAQMKVTEEAFRTKGFELVGGVFFDGLTSMAQVVMHDMDRMRGHGFIGGEKSSFGGTITSGDLKFGGNNRADVGFAQTRAEQWVGNSLSIPYLKESPVFTGLSTEGTDKGGLTVIGVDLPGQAALTQAPQWFGNIVEASSIVDENGKKHHVLYVRPFTDAQGRSHLLKSSASSTGSVPNVLIDPPDEDKRPFDQFSLGRLFKLLDEDLVSALTEELPGAPGMPSGLSEYGEAFSVEPGLTAPGSPTGSVTSTPSPKVVQAGASAPSAPTPARKEGVMPPGAGKPPQPPSPAPSALSSSAAAAPAKPSTAPMPPGRPPARAPGK